MKTIYTLFVCLLFLFQGKAQTHPAIERFLSASYMKGASASIMVKEIHSGSVLYSYEVQKEMIPASVMKLVTTASALEILGENYRFETAIMYDGHITNGTLHGNLYIRGSGDPTPGSSEMGTDRDKIIRQWIKAMKDKGIRAITGSVIADESIFDTEGISMKWLREDIGSYYGQGCYGLNFFDNHYSLYLNTGAPDDTPEIIRCEPEIPGLFFRNYLKTNGMSTDSMYIIGFPYANERYLYGTVPANRSEYKLKGDIPDPALFLAQYLTQRFNEEHITVAGTPTCHRLLSQEGFWKRPERILLTASYSPPLKNLVRITNHKSNNLYADALVKTIGLANRSEETVSSFEKGTKILSHHWDTQGLNTTSLWMFDGSGLALTDKISAHFLCDLLSYMATQSAVSGTFIESIPRAGIDGTVSNFLRGTRLQGKARLKSGSMNRIRSYAGYITKDNKQYAVAILVNNFSCKQSKMKADIEQLLLALF